MNSTVSPDVTRSVHGVPTPEPTEHCAPVTSSGNVTLTCACSITLFQDPAMTFQKNVDSAVGSPTLLAKRRFSPVLPGSSTPGTVYRIS